MVCLWAAASAMASGNAAPVIKQTVIAPAKAVKAKSVVESGNTQVTPETIPALGDAFIAQNELRIFLNRPAAISVFNARGQMVFHLDSHRAWESVPLSGVTTGFLYLTVREGQVESTKKFVYTGK